MDDKLEVLAIELGDKERKDLWAELFQDLIRRGLDPEAVELGIMDGLPGLEDAFRAAFAVNNHPKVTPIDHLKLPPRVCA